MIQLHDVEQGSSDWLELRAGLYTGSNADKLLKFGAIDYSLTESGKFRGNFWTKRGHILEAEAIELYEQITKRQVDRPGFVTNSAYPGTGYSPDGLLPDRLIEVKCFDINKHFDLILGNIPLKVLAQIHFGLLICEMPQADLIAYNPTVEDPKQAFKIINIKANRNVQANFKRILSKERTGVAA